MSHWGYHLILNARNCRPAPIRSAESIAMFSKHLVTKINMVPYGEPQVVLFGTGNKKGYTLVQLIETSNICAHFVEENNSMYLDVFSCKPFDAKDVKEVLHLYFAPEHSDAILLKRDAHKRLL